MIETANLAVDPHQAMLELQKANLQRFAAPNGNIVRSPEESQRLYESAKTPEEQKIKKTADEFVSILYGMLFREMDKTVERTGLLDGGKTEEMFRSFVFDEYAKNASSNTGTVLNNRIYEMLYEANSKIKR
ncbi:MAG: hypothetical protein COS94_02275 [Candidatus Hydrogenedentes bacterium CG07_land_8_20_14_0_80_42_17]|nr:MAG: hypothetical protein AUJ18_03310 [Candidatus Hydrogenedentes bacterium CG1_02_42_14]PIU48415.1 MAG: hypothetical protein COS94_02275 [Candidatus Hydrogenedentes bacterium CG07_land_8_20_14_0_80_42_17]